MPEAVLPTPSISILLPVFNGAAFLREQIESILNQTRTDFELLVIDDGSSDGSVALIEGFARQDDRVRLLPSTGNAGQKARLLELLRSSRAPLIGFADQDDVWHPAKLERLTAVLGDSALAYGRSELIDAKGKPLGLSLIESFGDCPLPDDRLTYLFVPRISAHAMLVRREAVTEAAFRGASPFDWLIGLDALFTQGVTYVDDAIVYHRLHGANQVNGAARFSLFRHLLQHTFKVKLTGPRRHLLQVVERIDHLTSSPILDEAARSRFSRLAQICRRGSESESLARGQNESEIPALLAPLAGSDRDAAIAIEYLDHLMARRMHPRSLYRFARSLIGLRSAPSRTLRESQRRAMTGLKA